MRLSLCGVALTMIACGPVVPPPPAAVPDGPVNWSYIAVGSYGAQVRARGFDGAVPKSAHVAASVDGQELIGAEADTRGRFDLLFDATQDHVDIVVSGADLEESLTLTFAVHDMTLARTDAVHQRLAQTGSVPSSISLASMTGKVQDAVILVANTGDNTVDNIALDSGARNYPALVLPSAASTTGPVAAQPFGTVVLGQIAAVSRLGHSAITLFDISRGAMLAQLGEMQAYILPEPLVPATPVDGNGDGTLESLVTAVWPRTFEGIAASAEHLFVCAANLLRATAPIVYAPGMVMVYDWRSNSLGRGATPLLWTHFYNPQVALVQGDALVVVETGTLALGAQGWSSSSDGGIELFSVSTLQSIATFNLGRVAPGSAVLSPDGRHLYVGSLLKPELYKIDLVDKTVLRGPDNPIVLFSSQNVQSIFSLVAHPMGLLFATNFNSDQIFVVDTLNDSVLPWPFDSALQVGEGGMAFAGAQALVLRPGRNGVDFRGPDFAVLMGLAARIATVDTRQMMGP